MVPLLRTPLISSPHGFTGRAGGVSEGPWRSLNLSTSVGDDPTRVEENRRRVLAAFGHPPLARLSQVHGARAIRADGPGIWEGDALVSQSPGLLLAVSTADCYPLLFEDPITKTVAAAHAGWRGVIAGIVERTLDLMETEFHSRLEQIRVAIGPGICGRCYQVGPEVAEAFDRRGLGDALADDPAESGRYRLDLEKAIEALLQRRGVSGNRVWRSGQCTYENTAFFSYRRQGAKSGRMWGLIQVMPSVSLEP